MTILIEICICELGRNGNFPRPSRKRQYGVHLGCQKTLTALRWGQPLGRSENGLREGSKEEVVIADCRKCEVREVKK